MDYNSKDSKVLLIQARPDDDPMLEHELLCFSRASGLDRSHFRVHNLAQNGSLPSLLDIRCVMIGGSGTYSVSKGNVFFFDSFRRLFDNILKSRLPTFATCFGAHLIAEYLLKGTVVDRSEKQQVGTFDIYSTEAAKKDTLFRQLPDVFPVQMGHKDGIVRLPDDCTILAYDEDFPIQAYRLSDYPIYATQFHPELDAEGNRYRYEFYFENYGSDNGDGPDPEILSSFRDSPEADRLLKSFLELFVI